MGGLRGLFTAIFGGVASALFYLAASRGGIGGAILVAMSSLPLFAVGLSQGTRFLVLAVMIAAGLCSNLVGQAGTAQFLIGMVLPALILVPVALSSGPLPHWLRLWRTKPDEAGALPPQSAGAVEERGAGPNSIKPKSWFEKSVGKRNPLLRVSDKLGKPRLDPVRVILVTVFLGLLAFVCLIVGAHSMPGGLRAIEEKAATDSLHQIQGLVPADVSAMLAKAPIKALSAALPGFGIVIWLLTTVVNAVLAQGALSSFGWNLRAVPPMASIAIPRWIGLVFAVSLAAAVLGKGIVGFAGLNVAIILGIALVFDGLSVLHGLAARSPVPGVFLVTAYLVGVILGWPILLIAILGLSDQLLDLRRRLAGARQGEK